jgi:hypothetical protein
MKTMATAHEDRRNEDGKTPTEDVEFVGVALLPMVEVVTQDDDDGAG